MGRVRGLFVLRFGFTGHQEHYGRKKNNLLQNALGTLGCTKCVLASAKNTEYYDL
jgi:hypothetical protein